MLRFALATLVVGCHSPMNMRTIRVVGRQWWWQLHYHADDPGREFTSANKIQNPVGQSVRVLLTSADVIPNFCVPQLQGKLDTLPGDTNDLGLTASVAGVYAGKCAKIYGAQLADMAITVIAEDSVSFARWETQQHAEARASADATIAHGAALSAYVASLR